MKKASVFLYKTCGAIFQEMASYEYRYLQQTIVHTDDYTDNESVGSISVFLYPVSSHH